MDERWAALGQGLRPDADEPSFDPDTTSSFAYEPVTPEALVAQSQLYQLNGIATLHIFGRFYAGGSIAEIVVRAPLGHVTPGMTERYAGVKEATKVEALTRLFQAATS